MRRISCSSWNSQAIGGLRNSFPAFVKSLKLHSCKALTSKYDNGSSAKHFRRFIDAPDAGDAAVDTLKNNPSGSHICFSFFASISSNGLRFNFETFIYLFFFKSFRVYNLHATIDQIVDGLLYGQQSIVDFLLKFGIAWQTN